MSSENNRRLAKLEALQTMRPKLAVLIANDGEEARVRAEYLASIPPDRQPELTIVIHTFCRDDWQGSGLLYELDEGAQTSYKPG